MHLHEREAERSKQSSSIGKHFIKGKLKAKNMLNLFTL